MTLNKFEDALNTLYHTIPTSCISAEAACLALIDVAALILPSQRPKVLAYLENLIRANSDHMMKMLTTED